MKKYTKWGIGIALFPFALFVVICILLYVPPVQRFLVSTATRYASEASGMDIHIGRLSLSFPLDLVVHEAQVVDGRDTILNVDRLTVEVQLLPLVRRQVEIDGVRLTGAAVNTAGLVEGMTLKGEVGELFLRSHGVDLSPETAVLNNLLLIGYLSALLDRKRRTIADRLCDTRVVLIRPPVSGPPSVPTAEQTAGEPRVDPCAMGQAEGSQSDIS